MVENIIMTYTWVPLQTTIDKNIENTKIGFKISKTVSYVSSKTHLNHMFDHTKLPMKNVNNKNSSHGMFGDF